MPVLNFVSALPFNRNSFYESVKAISGTGSNDFRCKVKKKYLLKMKVFANFV